jgi:hypothetical protein
MRENLINSQINKYISNDNDLVLILPTDPLTYSDSQLYYYFIDTGVVYKLNTSTKTVSPSLDYKVFVGRDKLKFQYTHSADYESRVDPGASNIIDVFILTKGYDAAFRQWLNGANITKPLAPSSDELFNTVAPTLNLIKSISDEIIYHPVSYKILFGSTADEDVQASFKIVKNIGQVLTDNEAKARVVTAMNQFFALENWDFGDTFYFTELATYVVNQLAPDISNFVIVPRQSGLNFGSLFEIACQSNEILVSGASANDIEIIDAVTASQLKSTSAIVTTSGT